MTPRSAWIAVTAMFVLNGALFGVWASRVPAVQDAFEMTHAELGGLLLALAGGAVCAFPFAGRAVDRLGAARVTKGLAVIYPVTLLLLPLAPDRVSLGIALFLFGASHGAMDVAMNSWGAEAERRHDRRMMSSFHAMFSLGAGIGALSGYWAVLLGADMLVHFALVGGVVPAVSLFLAHIPWEAERAEPAEGGAIFAFPSGPLVLVGIVAFCSSLGEGAMVDWSAIYLRDVVSVGEEVAALGYAVFSVAMVVVRLLGDRITMRVGPVRAARAGGLVAGAGILLAILVPMLETTLIGFALLGVGYAVIMPIAFSRAANDPDVPPGRAISSVATLGYGGLLLGPPVIGFLSAATTLQVAFAVLAVLAGVIVLAAGALRAPGG